MQMLQKTVDFMKKNKMAAAGEKIVIGLSGGMDSVCLFYLLRDMGYLLEAVHVHHGIRGEEADRDEAFVKHLCEVCSVPFHGYRFDVPKISRENHQSEEEAGRLVRRQAFVEVLEKTQAQHIALAHHGNDRAETFLFHLSRGSGIRGLSSMKPVEGKMIRPLLWAERAEIERYVKKMAYAYVEDTTNSSVDYTRNKIRHQIIPLLEEVNQKSVSHILGAAEKLSEVSAYIEREAEKLCRLSAVMYGKEVNIMKFAFEQGDEMLRIPVLRKCVEYLTGSLVNITEGHYQKLLELMAMQAGKEVHLPGGLTAVRTYEGICIFLKSEKEYDKPVKIMEEGEYFFGNLTFRVMVEDWEEGQFFPIKTYTKCFDYDKIKGTLFLRTRQQGDYLEINKNHGRKSIQDYMVNEKIPKNERDQVILLADDSHVLWVVGKRISENYKITNETKRILKVQVCGGNIYE